MGTWRLFDASGSIAWVTFASGPRILSVLLRVLLAVLGVGAVAFGAAWTYETLHAFQPGFNDHGGVPEGYKPRVAILGFFGILASLCAAGSALAYSRKPARRWIWSVVLGGLCAIVLFVLWYDAWEYAGGVG